MPQGKATKLAITVASDTATPGRPRPGHVSCWAPVRYVFGIDSALRDHYSASHDPQTLTECKSLVVARTATPGPPSAARGAIGILPVGAVWGET